MTTYTTLDAKYSEEIRQKFIDWLNDNLDDPYEQSTHIKRSNFVYGSDFKLVKIFPKIHFDIQNFEVKNIGGQTKTTYLDEEEHSFIIYYYNQRGHRYTFGNGSTLIDESQCRRYLQYIRRKIKNNSTEFDEYCHKITFGSISKPEFLNQSSVFVAMLPITVYTYQR